MGKTRLAARFAAEAHAGGATVLHGRIDEETVVPYQPFVEALRHYAAHARPVTARATSRRSRRWSRSWAAAPARPSGERENRRYRLFEAVAALLGQRRRRRGRCCS